jgi:hypothetical protein
MNRLRRFLGFALYLFMAFPLTLGGLALASIKPVAGDSAAVKSMIADARLERLLSSPDLVEMAPPTVEIGGAVLDGKAAVKAFQSSVPASALIQTATGAVDSAYAAFARGEAFFSVDSRSLKAALKGRSPVFAETYLGLAGAAGTSAAGDTALPAVTDFPETAAGRAALSSAVAAAVDAQPDAWTVGEIGSTIELPRGVGALGAGLTGASYWLLVTGAGLCFASVMVSEGDWRRRLGKLGSRLLAPSVIILVIGLGPKLVMPSGLIRLPSGASGTSLPDLVEYLRFLAGRVSSGFLTWGLIGLGAGTAFVSVKRALPPPEDEEDLA